jgi:hypothetical protein
MAVSAVNAHPADMVGMTELDGLLDVVVLSRVIARQVEHPDDAAERQGEENDAENAEPGIEVGVALEYLTHRFDVRPARCPLCAPPDTSQSVPQSLPLAKKRRARMQALIVMM